MNARKSHPPNVKKTSITNAAARSAPGTSHNKTSHGHRKVSKKHKQSDEAAESEIIKSEDEGLMASAFPQFCDRCGTQMLSANASYYLYCSDQCSRGENVGRASTSRAFTTPNLSNSYRQASEQPESLTKRYVPKAEPTPLPSSLHSRMPPYQHEYDRDLDPTEWKPAEHGDYVHGPRKRITLNNPYDFSQGYTEHAGHTPDSQEGVATRSSGVYPASMPTSKSTSRIIRSTPRPEILRQVPSLSRASTFTASSPSSTESFLSDEVSSFVPAAMSPRVGITNVSVSQVSVLEETKAMSLKDSREQYSKYPVQSNKSSDRARGSLKTLLHGKS